MARELGEIKAEFAAVKAENDKRIAARDALYERLDAEFGTHDRAELEKILAERKQAVDEAIADYNEALEKADAYVIEKKKELGL